MIDLHMHTSMSDGSDSPLELLNKIQAMGIQFFSITDHDDLQANSVIKEQQGNIKAKFVTGCEISSVFKGKNIHLLCYDFDINSPSIKTLITQGATLRKQRINAMFDHLRNKHNIIICDKDRSDILSKKIPGKVHITDVALKQGINMSRQQFFDTCLNDMESKDYKIDAQIVIDLVHKSQGIVSLAHPIEIQKEYNLDFNEIQLMAKTLKDKGLTAIEVYHSLHSLEHIISYNEIAKKANLYISGGSDYHGKNKNVAIGQLSTNHLSPTIDKLTILTQFKNYERR